MTLKRLDLPFIRHLPVSELKRLPVRSLNSKALLTGPAPACQHFRDLEAPALPSQRQRAIGVFGIRTAFNSIHGTAFYCSLF